MVKIKTAHNLLPCQVDGLPEECQRTTVGAIYLRPSSIITLTKDELEYLKAKRPDLHGMFSVLPSPSRPKAKKIEGESAKKETASSEPQHKPKPKVSKAAKKSTTKRSSNKWEDLKKQKKTEATKKEMDSTKSE